MYFLDLLTSCIIMCIHNFLFFLYVLSVCLNIHVLILETLFSITTLFNFNVLLTKVPYIYFFKLDLTKVYIFFKV